MQSGRNQPFGSFPPGPGVPPPGPSGTPALRASDADRDRVVDLLSTHYQAGRLTVDEFHERSSQALQARTMGDLAALLTDLPALPGNRPEPAAQPVVTRQDFNSSAAAGILAVLAVVVVVFLLTESGAASTGRWVLIIPVLIIFRLLARRRND